jgi:hypothetical protein
MQPPVGILLPTHKCAKEIALSLLGHENLIARKAVAYAVVAARAPPVLAVD